MARFLMIGALALDRPLRLERPLARGARVAARSLEGRLAPRLGGGAANAGVALRLAGHDIYAASVVAQDSEGSEALARAAAAGLDVSLCVRRLGASATTLILVEPDGERLVIALDREPGALVLPPLPPPKRAGDLDLDGVFIRAAYPGSAEWAGAARVSLLHWPAPAYSGAAEVVVASADDLTADVLADPLAATRAQLGDGVKWVVVTRGSRGAQAFGAHGSLTCPAAPARVVDATGAGDIFAAGLLEALCAGAAMRQALAHASAWGATAVGLDASAPVEAEPGLFAPYG